MVSIVIPIFNVEKYIYDCIDSVLNQEYKDIEVILIDDGSTDNSGAIAQEIALKNKNVYYYRQENGGAAAARNNGIEHAHGEFIMFVDADDEIEPTLIDELLPYAVKGNYDIVACSCMVFDEYTSYEEHFFENSFIAKGDGKKILYEQLIDLKRQHPGIVTTAIGVPWGKLYKTDFLKKEGLYFDVALRRAQDNIFNMYAFKFANAVYYHDACLYKYRKDHISAFKNTEEQLYQVLNARKVFFDKYPEVLTAELKSLYQNEIMLYLFVSLFRMVGKNCSNNDIRLLLNKPIYIETIKKIKVFEQWGCLSTILRMKQIWLIRCIFKCGNIVKEMKYKLRKM